VKVNIVMLVKDRRRLTAQALTTLYKNTPKELFNLVIVDDGSAQPISVLQDGMVVLRIWGSSGITGQARNLGVYWAEKYWGRGDYLYLSDNDVYFTPQWLDKLVRIFESTQPYVKLIGGWNHTFLQPRESVELSSATYLKSHDAVTGASQLMRWATWDKYGPLDAHTPGVCPSEDWQFCQNIIKDGGRVGSVYPRVVFNCGLTNSFGQPSVGADVVLKELQEAKKKYPDLYWE
jgi:Glycosyl transferase family 2